MPLRNSSTLEHAGAPLPQQHGAWLHSGTRYSPTRATAPPQGLHRLVKAHLSDNKKPCFYPEMSTVRLTV